MVASQNFTCYKLFSIFLPQGIWESMNWSRSLLYLKKTEEFKDSLLQTVTVKQTFLILELFNPWNGFQEA